MDWRKVKKIDAHVHLLPKEKVEYFKSNKVKTWANTDVEDYLKIMEKYNIEKAVLVPINEPETIFSDPLETNIWFQKIKNKYKNKFYAFCDVVNKGYFYRYAPYWIEKAVKENNLNGLKIHPSNLSIDFDSLDMIPAIRKASDLNIPIMVHSYPYSKNGFDYCLPQKIHNISKVFPDATFIISHLGGPRWEDALAGNEYVDISFVLVEFVEKYGIEQTERILKAFGADRLIFSTDFPQVHLCETDKIYEKYFDILNKMNFSDEEIEKIAYKNIEKILNKIIL